MELLMAKPDSGEIHRLAELARNLAGGDADEGRLARCFLYFHDRNLGLEEVYYWSERCNIPLNPGRRPGYWVYNFLLCSVTPVFQTSAC